MKPIHFLLTAVVLALTARIAAARVVRFWSYQELFDQSDLVVIAAPISRSADTNKESILPNITSVGREGNVTGVECIGLETTFVGSTVLKEAKNTRRFISGHCREAP